MNTDTVFINSQIDIRDAAEQAGAQFRGGRSRCPIHGGDNPQAFEVFDGGRRWTCHTRAECNRFGHDGIALLRALNNWSFVEVKERYNMTFMDPMEAARRATENAKRVEQELQDKIVQAQKAIDELRQARRWIEDHESMTQDAVTMWEMRGIPPSWQGFWMLGYRPNFSYSHAGQSYTSPTLTIPLFEARQDEPVNIKHRLLNPIAPQDKYRQERSGIEARPFLGDRDLPLADAERVIVVEGEIKAAVTFLTLDHILWQVVGIPGKQSWSKLIPELQGRTDTVIMLDPDAKTDAVKMARSIGGAKVVDLPGKIDDMILESELDGKWIEAVFHNARLIK